MKRFYKLDMQADQLCDLLLWGALRHAVNHMSQNAHSQLNYSNTIGVFRALAVDLQHASPESGSVPSGLITSFTFI